MISSVVGTAVITAVFLLGIYQLLKLLSSVANKKGN